MRIQEAVDTSNKLRRESTPDYTSLSMGKPAKTGSILDLPDFLKCANLAFTLACRLAKAARTGAAPADSELLMPR
jgi:hypothetical protein